MSTVNISTIIKNTSKYKDIDKWELVKLRMEGKTKKEIASSLGLKKLHVQRACRDLYVNEHDLHVPKEKDLLDSELGYVCGLIAADGHLIKFKSSVGCTLTITLHRDDDKTLYWLSERLFPGEVRVFNYPYTKNSLFVAAVPNLFRECTLLGMTHNKSLTLDVNLEGKSEEFLWHFLRGVIDGDGHIYQFEGRNRAIRIVCGSEAFTNTLFKYFGGRLFRSWNTKQQKYYFGIEWRLISNLPVYLKLPKEDYMLERKTAKLEESIEYLKDLVQLPVTQKNRWVVNYFKDNYPDLLDEFQYPTELEYEEDEEEG